jgi:hypothetical protein
LRCSNPTGQLLIFFTETWEKRNVTISKPRRPFLSFFLSSIPVNSIWRTECVKEKETKKEEGEEESSSQFRKDGSP